MNVFIVRIHSAHKFPDESEAFDLFRRPSHAAIAESIDKAFPAKRRRFMFKHQKVGCGSGGMTQCDLKTCWALSTKVEHDERYWHIEANDESAPSVIIMQTDRNLLAARCIYFVRVWISVLCKRAWHADAADDDDDEMWNQQEKQRIRETETNHTHRTYSKYVGTKWKKKKNRVKEVQNAMCVHYVCNAEKWCTAHGAGSRLVCMCVVERKRFACIRKEFRGILAPFARAHSCCQLPCKRAPQHEQTKNGNGNKRDGYAQQQATAAARTAVHCNAEKGYIAVTPQHVEQPNSIIIME